MSSRIFPVGIDFHDFAPGMYWYTLLINEEPVEIQKNHRYEIRGMGKVLFAACLIISVISFGQQIQWEMVLPDVVTDSRVHSLFLVSDDTLIVNVGEDRGNLADFSYGIINADGGVEVWSALENDFLSNVGSPMTCNGSFCWIAGSRGGKMTALRLDLESLDTVFYEFETPGRELVYPRGITWLSDSTLATLSYGQSIVLTFGQGGGGGILHPYV